ncbi:MAG: hypothetical protein ABOK23_12005 [Candidatus Methanoperedens sp.]|nr:hypothetical protein [Candidatus Methanoperedens sp.]MCZ7395270.1 hypothetical protein [Candidatus Methanoperedens sp.]
MGVSKDEFEKGKKPLEKGSLEYDILEFLKNATKTDEPARNEKEILEALNITAPQEKRGIMAIVNYTEKATAVRFALLSLESEGKIVSKAIKTEGKAESVTYYMAK